MSQPKRYSVAVNDPWFGNGAYVAEDGKYVLYSDYADLAAEYVELKDLYLKCRIDIGNLHKENERLTAEVEWLRKADRLVCWNPTTQQWEVRHEALK